MRGRNPSNNRVKFGEFEVDLRAGEVRENGTKRKLQEQPLQILAMLLERPGDVVTRDEIRERIWGETFVDFEHSLNTAVNKLRQALNDHAEQPRFIETLPRHGYRFVGEIVGDRADRRARLAILPFQNLGRPDDDYLASGLTEELIARLGGSCQDVDIIALASAAGSGKRLRNANQICNELQVSHLLMGSVQRSSEQCRITAKLMRALDHCYVWADSYTCGSEEIFAMQDTMAREIRESIVSVLEGASHKGPKKATRADVYEKYLKARHGMSCCTMSGFVTAVQLLQEVIDEDPEFAPAYAALAGMHAWLGTFSAMPPEIIASKLEQLVKKALSLDERLEEAHVARAWKSLAYDVDFAATEKHVRRAMEINPSYAYAHHVLGMAHGVEGKYGEAVAEMTRALDLDPLHPAINTAVAMEHYYYGSLEEAYRQARYTSDLHPQLGVPHAVVSWIETERREFARAEESARTALLCEPRNDVLQANLAETLAAAGKTGEAVAELEGLVSRRKEEYVSAYWIALGYVALGEIQEALTWMETAENERCLWRHLAGIDPRLAPLHAEKRFLELLERMGLKPLARGAVSRVG